MKACQDNGISEGRPKRFFAMQAGLPTVRMIRSPPSAPMGAAMARSPENPAFSLVKPRRKRGHSFSGQIIGVQPAAVVHGRCDLRRLRARRRAKIDDGLSGTDIEKTHGKLGTQTLFDEPAGKMMKRQGRVIGLMQNTERILKACHAFCLKTIPSEDMLDLVTGRTHRIDPYKVG